VAVKSEHSKMVAREYSHLNRHRLNKEGVKRYHRLRKTKAGREYLSNLGRDTRKRKKDWLVAFKEKAGCKDCKKKLPHYMLEFDHCRGSKVFSMGMVAHRSWHSIFEEMDKCDVVCANCHKSREWHRWMKYVALHDGQKNGCLNCRKKLKRKYQVVFCGHDCKVAWVRQSSAWGDDVVSENQKRHAKKPIVRQ
jgi:hypothetical protein